jgi:hypothetical protein
MKIAIIVAVWLGLVAWYGYEVYSIQKENALVRLQQLKAIDQE